MSKVVLIGNVMRLMEASDALLQRAPNTPGMALCHGPTGFGKSIATAWLATRKHAVFVRALRTSTPTSLLDQIARELNIEPGQRVAKKVEAIVEELVRTERPLFVDEADYVVGKDGDTRLADTLRDLHDLSDVPVILIGMAGIDRKIRNSPQLAGRMAQWVKFEPCTHRDAQLLASELLKVELAEDLVHALCDRAAGEVRLITVGLGKIEQFARKHGKTRMELADWPRGQSFYMGDDGHAPAARQLRAV